MKKKNILIALPTDRIGGAEIYLKIIVEEFASQDFRFYIVVQREKDAGIFENIKAEEKNIFYNSAVKDYWFFSFILNIWRNRKIQFDYAFTSCSHLNSLVGLFRILHILKIKYFVARENTLMFNRKADFNMFKEKMYYLLGYSAIDLLICQTEYMKQQLVENLPWLEKKVNVQVIANPINLDNSFSKAKEKVDYNFEFSCIVAAGRLVDVKGFDILIHAFSKLKQKYKSLKLVILGEGKLRGVLAQQINDLHLEDDIILYGSAKNVYPFFKNARMCVVSSRIEGFPNVLLQEMSQNEKIVSTLCADGIDKLEGVFTCKTNDEADLVRAMKECLVADTSKNREIFDKELQSRSIDKFVKRIMDYEKAMKEQDIEEALQSKLC